MKHVCVVTSAHPWDDVRVGSRMVEAFLDAGNRVTWIGPDHAFFLTADARTDRVEYRLFIPARGRVGRLTSARKATDLAASVQDVDWWYTPDPDMAARLPKLAERMGGKTLFDVHESYHGGLLNRWFPGTPPSAAREFLRRRIAATCSRVDLVIGVSQSVLDPYCADAPETLVVRNCAPYYFSGVESPVQRPSSSRMRFMHGKLSSGNGTRQVLEAVNLLDHEAAAESTVIMLEMAGAGDASTSQMLAEIANLPHATVDVLPGMPHREMAQLMATCSAGLIAYQRDLGYESLPNRLFEYMAAGLAVIAPSYSPEIVRIIEAEGVGLVVDFESPREIAYAVEWCIANPDEVSNMGERAWEAFTQRHNWQHEAGGLIQRMRALE